MKDFEVLLVEKVADYGASAAGMIWNMRQLMSYLDPVGVSQNYLSWRAKNPQWQWLVAGLFGVAGEIAALHPFAEAQPA